MRRSFALLVVCVVAMAGCGGDDDKAPANVPTFPCGDGGTSCRLGVDYCVVLRDGDNEVGSECHAFPSGCDPNSSTACSCVTPDANAKVEGCETALSRACLRFGGNVSYTCSR